MKIGLAMVLAASLLATGCTAQWISVALADLPVLTQMALNMAALVATWQSGKQLKHGGVGGDPEHFRQKRARTSRCCRRFTTSTRPIRIVRRCRRFDNAIGDINQNLPALLQAAHISDATLSAQNHGRR